MFDIVTSIVGAVIGGIAGAVLAGLALTAPPLAIAVATGAIVGGGVGGVLGGSIDDCINKTKDVGGDLVNLLNRLSLPNDFPLTVEVKDYSGFTRYFESGTAISTVTLKLTLKFNELVSPTYTVEQMINSIHDVFKSHGFDNITVNHAGSHFEIVGCTEVDDEGKCVGDEMKSYLISSNDIDLSDSFVFIGQDAKSLSIYFVVAVVDGITGGVKHVHTQRVTVNAQTLHLRLNKCSCCDGILNAIACPLYTIGYWLGFTPGWGDNTHICTPPDSIDVFDAYVLFSNTSDDVTISLSFEGPLNEGDQIYVYALSPMFIIQLKTLCSSSNASSYDVCKNVDVSRYCSTGYYVDPSLFEMVLKTFGYYNDYVLKLATAVANGGYLFSNKVLYLDSDKLKYIVDSTELKVTAYVPEISGDTVTGMKYENETYDLSNSNTTEIDLPFEDATRIVAKVPLPFALTIEGSNSDYYMVLDPMGILSATGTLALLNMSKYVTNSGIVGQMGSSGLFLVYLPTYEKDMSELLIYGGTIEVSVSKMGTMYLGSVSVSVNNDNSGAGGRLAVLLSNVLNAVLNKLSLTSVVVTPYPVITEVVNVAKQAKAELIRSDKTSVTYRIEVKDGGFSIENSSE